MIWTVYMQHVCLSSTSYGIYGFMHPPCFCPYEDLQIGPWTLLTRYGPLHFFLLPILGILLPS
jgi:hypothetical protein